MFIDVVVNVLSHSSLHFEVLVSFLIINVYFVRSKEIAILHGYTETYESRI